MIADLLAPLRPGEMALSLLLRNSITDDMLREIAGADYGWMAEECSAVLQRALREGVFSAEEFHVREVLELTRLKGTASVRDSWIQLFTCTCLLQMTARFPEYSSNEPGTLAVFVSSAVDLGEPAVGPAAAFLAGRFLGYPIDTEESPFFSFAILLLSVSIKLERDCGPWLRQLAKYNGRRFGVS